MTGNVCKGRQPRLVAEAQTIVIQSKYIIVSPTQGNL